MTDLGDDARITTNELIDGRDIYAQTKING